MWDKFGEFDSWEEINRAAKAQLEEGDMDAVRAIAEENGIDPEDELYEEGVKQVETYKDIECKINQLTNQEERDVLFYKYIKGLDFWEIGQILGYSERWIHKLHGDALKKIQIS